ncbi:restriction endonuclease subunit S [Clostridium disporicum]|uniref:restriction endonuclease subunit S n=1 Tax=Clostridium disporicum TaxID=84024 RepID=UPI00361561CB
MKNVPKLRFNGFSDEWEVKKLDEVTTYVDYRGKTPPKTEKGIFLVTAKNIKMGYIDYNVSQEFIAKESYKESMRRGLPKIGDVLLTTEAPLGNVAQVDRDDIALAQRVIKFRGIEGELNNAYLKQYFISGIFQNALMNKAIGTTVLGIQGKVLHKMLIKFPSMEEQEKIASFLTKVDRLIEKQDEKISNLEQYKKGMMQKIFSQEIRFKKADGGEYPEWRNDILGKLGETYSGLSGKTKENFGFGKGKYITYMNVFKNIRSDINMVDLVDIGENEQQNNVLKGDILFTTSSETPEEVGMASVCTIDEKSLYLNSFCFGFRLNDTNKVSSDFLAYFLRSPKIRLKISILAQGSTRYNLSKTELMKMNITMPCFEEQIKIANFLSNIDSIVEKEKEKLEELRTWKKGLLQGMFI